MKYDKLITDYGYVLNTRPYELNILGVRSDSTTPNSFDDKIIVFYKDDRGKWQVREYAATTDPSTYWLLNPSYVEGTALLMQGQYKYRIGTHKGQYTALNPAGAVRLLRQYQRDNYLDFLNGNEVICENGCGINIHRANSTGTTQNVNLYSAGCQVFANATDFADFIGLCENHAKLYGNAFLYTLIDERALARRNRRWILYALLVLGCLLLLGAVHYFGYYRFKFLEGVLPQKTLTVVENPVSRFS